MFRVQRNSLAAGLTSFALAAGLSTAALAGSHTQSSVTSGLSGRTYAEFQSDISDISKLRLDKPQNIHRAQAALVAFDERDLSHSFVAHMAGVAASSGKFKRGLDRAARRYGGRKALVARIEQNPRTIYTVRGWKDASDDVSAAIAHDNAAMSALKHRLSEIAYGRTANEARYAQEARNGSNGAGITGAIPAPRSANTSTAAMSQILALGGIMSLTHASAAELKPAAAAVAVNKHNDQCLRWADLNLKQCLAAAHDDNERAYCLSQEAIDARAKCWVSIANPAS